VHVHGGSKGGPWLGPVCKGALVGTEDICGGAGPSAGKVGCADEDYNRLDGRDVAADLLGLVGSLTSSSGFSPTAVRSPASRPGRAKSHSEWRSVGRTSRAVKRPPSFDCATVAQVPQKSTSVLLSGQKADVERANSEDWRSLGQINVLVKFFSGNNLFLLPAFLSSCSRFETGARDLERSSRALRLHGVERGGCQ
jgi:hypothetical protein